MQPYQKEYIENCRTIRELKNVHFSADAAFEEAVDAAMKDMELAIQLSWRNTQLLEQELLPALDDLFHQEEATLREMEEFADELTKAPKTLDAALACQIHEALVSRARRSGLRDMLIRELYKLGMARYVLWNMVTGLDLPNVDNYSVRMRYCFVEASSYLKYFEEFSEETQSYILRALANIYMGSFADWREKLSCVRRTMKVFTDEQYRKAAPGLPWDLYVNTVHRQMLAVLPYNINIAEKSLQPDAVADVMESAYLIYERQYEKALREGSTPQVRSLFSYHALEFRCGLISKEFLIKSVEDMMDSAVVTEYSDNNSYLLISLPAFYAQYLDMMPELIPPRKDYIIRLYRQMMEYIRNMPPEQITDQMSIYLRQALSKFIEVEGGVTYKELVLLVISRLSPGLFAHSHAVGEMARAVCRTILEGEPAYFDDIPEIGAMPAGPEKEAAVLEMAYDAGLLHDLGKTNFASLYDHMGRLTLHSEEQIMQLHAAVGWQYLKNYGSTRRCADVAYGHHRWYDGSDGYPDEFQRLKSPYRAMVDIVAFVDFLEKDENETVDLLVHKETFEEKIAQALQLEGRRFSPLVTGWIRTPALSERLKTLYHTSRRDGYHRCFRDRNLQEGVSDANGAQ